MTPFDDDVRSPCISMCTMDPSRGSMADRAAGGLCVGCLRTVDEIIEWGTATAGRKLEILANIGARRGA
jgi:predicted Fe-S protein YdhL (DUF1289 family)